MPGSMDLTGQRFGRLRCLFPIKERGRRFVWACRCDCGGYSFVAVTSLNNGHTKSCGCLNREISRITSRAHIKHGHARLQNRSAEYRVWAGAIQRTTNPNLKYWRNYGGRGIGICEHWRSSFEQFLVDMGPRSDGLTLDRIDNDKGYLCPWCCPPNGNCRWATRLEQVKNRRRTERMKKSSEARWSPELRKKQSEYAKAQMKLRWASKTIEERHAEAMRLNAARERKVNQ